ncbi:FAD-dependent oxidoreductase [Sunxiuqinia sp. sy24]|uniref:FAD-dependent oxidoreductase n=1 Tax=Sunxiuqinia sp. sy24 TaxID=3461495 RepID=UPI004045E345
MKKILTTLFLIGCAFWAGLAQSILVEAESFSNSGGWVVDPQFVEQMGSPYLLAHGLGEPVEDARTSIFIKKKAQYHVWVRTKNWVPGAWEAPGRFQILIDNQQLPNELGKNPGWNWEYAGEVELEKGQKTLSLHDLTGFDGRCDAVYLTQGNHEKLPNDLSQLAAWRIKQGTLQASPDLVEHYDLVVVGGGIAGCAASIAAAEQGLRVALIHDRPVLGGNASGEIRVHTLGIYGNFERILKMIDTEHYPNGSARALEEDERRHENMARYDAIDIYFNFRAFATNSENDRITSVDARNTETGEFIRYEAPLFVDCTGDGWIGYWAGAEYMYGREAASKYDESWDKHGTLWSPEKADNFVMGSSVLWGSENAGKPADFPEVPWAMDVAKSYAEANGEWQWEFSRNDLSQIDDAEAIRDHMFRAIYGSFYNYKNPVMEKPNNDQAEYGTIDIRKHQQRVDSLQLKWVSYLVGKRESRRLVGDYIFTFNDVRNQKKFEDGVVFEKREVDVHYQQNLQDPNKPDFLSEALFFDTPTYYIPYRSLYSKNIENLFMAGRDFSCSHIGLGGPRVMRTTGQMGAAVGLAASICKKYDVNPRAVYKSHLEEYLELIETQK